MIFSPTHTPRLLLSILKVILYLASPCGSYGTKHWIIPPNKTIEKKWKPLY